MEVKLYVGNLPFDTTEEGVREMFAATGTVISVALIKDRATGESKGFGFVEMASQKEAQNAITTLNGHMVGNRELRVSTAKAPETRGGGYNNGGGNRDRDTRRSGRRR
jgi:RNA recognition motif-containing protein